LFNSRRDRLIALAARHAVPTIRSEKPFVEAGHPKEDVPHGERRVQEGARASERASERDADKRHAQRGKNARRPVLPVDVRDSSDPRAARGRLWVYVSAGTGTWGPPVRLGTEAGAHASAHRGRQRVQVSSP